MIQNKKIGLLIASTLLLSSYGCSTVDKSLAYGQKQLSKASQTLGLQQDRTMQVPSYYSDKNIKKHYELGKQYNINHLD